VIGVPGPGPVLNLPLQEFFDLGATRTEVEAVPSVKF